MKNNKLTKNKNKKNNKTLKGGKISDLEYYNRYNKKFVEYLAYDNIIIPVNNISTNEPNAIEITEYENVGILHFSGKTETDTYPDIIQIVLNNISINIKEYNSTSKLFNLKIDEKLYYPGKASNSNGLYYYKIYGTLYIKKGTVSKELTPLPPTPTPTPAPVASAPKRESPPAYRFTNNNVILENS